MRRLYLDTADLIEIGDGRVSDKFLMEFVRAMAASETRLVLSKEHIQDISRGNAAAIESFVQAVERFSPVQLVVQGPEKVEPLTSDHNDLSVQACSNFRELVYSQAATEWLAPINSAYEQLHVGDQAAHRSITASTVLPDLRSRKANVLFLQAFVCLCRGWLGSEPEPVLLYWERELDIRVTPSERKGILIRLQAVQGYLTALLPVANAHEVDVTEALRQPGLWEAAPAQWPGHLLAFRVSAARRRNTRRKPLSSDLVDLDHVKHFPYVDIATCDAETHRGHSVTSGYLNGWACLA